MGGESFWSDIEQVIRTRAVKFIYVLSRTSNESNRGFRKELHLADSEAKKLAATLPRFVVPVAIDDLRSGDYNIYVQHLNCIPSRNWAKGLTDISGAISSRQGSSISAGIQCEKSDQLVAAIPQCKGRDKERSG
jgi:hypothetical protein